jgi:hypothetical protein
MFAAVLLGALGEIARAVRVSVPMAALVLGGVVICLDRVSLVGLSGGYAAGCLLLTIVMTSVSISQVGRVWTHR